MTGAECVSQMTQMLKGRLTDPAWERHVLWKHLSYLEELLEQLEQTADLGIRPGCVNSLNQALACTTFIYARVRDYWSRCTCEAEQTLVKQIHSVLKKLQAILVYLVEQEKLLAAEEAA